MECRVSLRVSRSRIQTTAAATECEDGNLCMTRHLDTPGYWR
jgi:hypothetical protein